MELVKIITKQKGQGKKMEPKTILSFTSHKARLPLIDSIFSNHVEVAEALGMDVCFACQDDSIPYLTDYQKELIDLGKVELLHVPKDHGSNTKWTLCRQAHPDDVMVVVDDDWEYDADGIKSLLETHERFPEAVICRAYRTIPWVGKDIPLYEVKPSYLYPKTITNHIRVNLSKESISGVETELKSGTAFPEHFLGVLYPSRFPSCSPCDIPKECRCDDDVFIGARAAAEHIKLVFAGRPRIAEDKDHDLSNALWMEARRGNGKRTYAALMSVSSEYSASLEGEGLGQVFLLTCKKYPLRRESIKKELSRLGIKYVEQYDDGTVYDYIGFKNLHVNRCHLAKYLALKKGLESQSSRITLIEDDVRFIKNISEVSEAIKTIPSDFGVCRFNWSESKFIRKEWEEKNPIKVVEIEKDMSIGLRGWVRCPWTSDDGCTILSSEVAKRYIKALEDIVIGNPESEVHNSDDLLSRICLEVDMPTYVYKPLACIQVQQSDVERGKCPSGKYFNPDSYHIPGVIRSATDYNFGVPSTQSNCIGKSGIDNDGFGYVRMSHSAITSGVPQQNPTINTSSSVNVLPRIGSVKRGYSNW